MPCQLGWLLLPGRSPEHQTIDHLLAEFGQNALPQGPLTFICDISYYKFPWDSWGLIDLIINQNDGIECSNLSTILNFVFTLTDISELLMLGTFTSMAELPEGMVHLQHWWMCPQGILSSPSLFLWRSCLMESSDLQDFSVIYNLYTVEYVLRL